MFHLKEGCGNLKVTTEGFESVRGSFGWNAVGPGIVNIEPNPETLWFITEDGYAVHKNMPTVIYVVTTQKIKRKCNIPWAVSEVIIREASEFSSNSNGTVAIYTQSEHIHRFKRRSAADEFVKKNRPTMVTEDGHSLKVGDYFHSVSRNLQISGGRRIVEGHTYDGSLAYFKHLDKANDWVKKKQWKEGDAYFVSDEDPRVREISDWAIRYAGESFGFFTTHPNQSFMVGYKYFQKVDGKIPE